MLYLDILDRCSVKDGFEGYSRLLKELSELLRVVNANEVLCPFDIREELYGPPDVPGGIVGSSQKGSKECCLVAVVSALLMQCIFGPFHASPVPFGLDAVFHVFIDRDGVPVQR